MAERTRKKWRMAACLLWLVTLVACQSQQSEDGSSQNAAARNFPVTASGSEAATPSLDQPGGGSQTRPSVSTPNQAAQGQSGSHDHGGGNEPDPEMGGFVFEVFCERCHDPYSEKPKPNGGPGLMNLFKVPVHALPGGDFHLHTKDYVRKAIEQGIGTMPGMANEITPTDMRDLMAYLKTI